MATRQYIGARYVIKVYENSQSAGSAEWEADTSYEPLTMVTYQNSSYLSKKDVPATVGNPASNPTYWALTGAYNGQIASLQRQITELAKLFTVEYYGAVGDGSTDDSQAFTDALSAHDVVYLDPSKSYFINSLTIPENHTIDGGGATIIVGSADAIAMENNSRITGVVFEDTESTYVANTTAVITASGKKGLTIDHCTFDDIHYSYCIRLDHCSFCDVVYNDIDGYSYGGIAFTHGCSYMKANYNKVYNGQYAGDNRYGITLSGYSVDLSNGPAHHLECCYNNIVDVNRLWEAIDSHGCTDAYIAFNYIDNFKTGIQLTNPVNLGRLPVNGDNVKIEHNVMLNCQTSGIGITVDSTKNKATNIVVDSNYMECSRSDSVESASIAGIPIDSSGAFENLKITNNNITHNKNGIALVCFDSTNIDVSNNNVSSGTDSSGVYAIWLDLHSKYTNVQVNNNNCHNSSSDFRGPAVAGAGSELLHMKNNTIDPAKTSRLDYTDFPRNTLSSDTKGIGHLGDFVPCSASGTTVGWYCINASTWLAVSGTSV